MAVLFIFFSLEDSLGFTRPTILTLSRTPLTLRLSQIRDTFGDTFALVSSAAQDDSPISGRDLDVLVDEMIFNLFAPCLTAVVSSEETRVFVELFVAVNFLFTLKRGSRVSLIADPLEVDLFDR